MKQYITTPIYYVNAKPHLGHTYTTTVADALKRFYQLTGGGAYLLTGTDEHGEKIEKKAKEKNITPQQLADEVSAEFRATWDHFGIAYDDFIRTTEERHKSFVQKILQKVYDQGDIYLHEYEGMYCVGCERFLRASEIIDGVCPDHKTAPEIRRETNYFFRLALYAPMLRKYLEEHAHIIRPEHYLNEVFSYFDEGIEDLCISRPKSRLTWGIELPFDSNFVTYVWFDALLNYVSALGGSDSEVFKTLWTHSRHLIGKDILKTHAIYWPGMLMAAGIPIFEHLDVHGFWLSEGSKMSKTVGNIVEPLEIEKKYSFEAMRYFMLREMRFGLDGNFTEELFSHRYHADLANGIGNLVNRVCVMIQRYLNGEIPAPKTEDPMAHDLKEATIRLSREYIALWESYEMNMAIKQQWEIFSMTDKYINESAPWTLAKDANKHELLTCVLATVVEMLRIQAILLYPVMPKTSLQILNTFGYSLPMDGSFSSMVSWGSQQSSGKLNTPSPLFPRIEKTGE